MKKNTLQKIERDENGLIKGIDYIFNEEGLVDWRKMIPVEYLVVNKQYFTSRKQVPPESIDGLEDSQLLTLLAGSKKLCSIRGFNSVEHSTISPSSDYVVSVCKIKWIPNYETEGREIIFSGIGDASVNNTTNFCKNYLGPIAENRAFVRCVRNFLRINVLSQEELGPQSSSQSIEDVGPNLLREIMQKNDISFDRIKEYLVKNGIKDAQNYSSLNDIPKFRQLDLIGKIKQQKDLQVTA